MTNEEKKMGTYLIGLVTDLENKLKRVNELSSQLKQEQNNFKNNILEHTKALEAHATFVRELKPAKVELSAASKLDIKTFEIYSAQVGRMSTKNNIYNRIMIFGISMGLIGILAMIFTYKFNVEAKSDIQEEYKKKILKEYSLIGKSDKILIDDMDRFFQQNPKTKSMFIKFREKNLLK